MLMSVTLDSRHQHFLMSRLPCGLFFLKERNTDTMILLLQLTRETARVAHADMRRAPTHLLAKLRTN